MHLLLGSSIFTDQNVKRCKARFSEQTPSNTIERSSSSFGVNPLIIRFKPSNHWLQLARNTWKYPPSIALTITDLMIIGNRFCRSTRDFFSSVPTKLCSSVENIIMRGRGLGSKIGSGGRFFHGEQSVVCILPNCQNGAVLLHQIAPLSPRERKHTKPRESYSVGHSSEQTKTV